MNIVKKLLWGSLGILVVGLILGIVFIPRIEQTIAGFTEGKYYDKGTNTIIVSNKFNKIGEYQLLENTDQCLVNCYAKGKTILYKDSRLFEDLDFKDRSGKFKELNNEIFYQIIEEYQVPIYKRVCHTEEYTINETLDNKTYKQVIKKKEVCQDQIDHYETKQRKIWKRYNFEELEAGTYYWKISGKKNPKDSIDWGVSALGLTTDEFREHWAWWDSNWLYARNYTITNNEAFKFYNYPMNISVNTSGLIAAGKMNADCSDVRWIDINGNEMPFNITSCNNLATNMTVSTNMSAGGTFNITLYYGNLGAGSTATDLRIYRNDNMTMGLYHMNEGAGITANDENGSYNANLVGNPEWNTSGCGAWGSCLTFDGAGDYLNTSTFGLSGNNNLTVEARVWINNTASTAFIYHRYGIGNADRLILVSTGAGGAGYEFKLEWGTGANWDSCSSGAGTSIDKTWQHVAVRLNASHASFIIDGVHVKQCARVRTAHFLAKSGLHIAGSAGFYADYKGNIDEVRISNRYREHVYPFISPPTYTIGHEMVGIIVPTVNLKFPKNSTQAYSGGHINFTYNVTDNGVTQNCSLWVKHSHAGTWEENATDLSITHTINQTFNLTLPHENIYWKVGCYDDTSNQGNSTTFNYTRILPHPTVNLKFPKNLTETDTKNINFTYNTTIPYGTISSCNLWLNNILNSTDVSITNAINQTFNITLNNTHIWDWKVECISNLNVRINSTTWHLIYNTAPTLPTILSPLNNTIHPSPSMNLSCSGATDPEGDTINYEFYLSDDTTFAMGTLQQNSSLTTFNSTAMISDHYYWRCRVNDGRENSAYTPIRKLTRATITNCSVGGTNSTAIIALNFTAWNDINMTLRVPDFFFDATFFVWGNDSDRNQTFTYDSTMINETIICLNPKNDTSLYVDAVITYGKNGYDTRNYFLDEKNIINTPNVESIKLFLSLTGLTTETTITVTDAEDKPLEDINVEAWMWDIATDTWSMVQSEITNVEGICKMDLIHDNYFVFRFYSTGTMMDSTNKFKLVSTSLTFKITTEERPLLPIVQLNNLLTNFSWNNVTMNITFNYSGADKIMNIDQICWRVMNMSSQNISVMYDHCWWISSNETGLDDYIIPTTHGSFRVYAYTFINGIQYQIDYYGIDLRELLPRFGQMGLLLGLLVVLTMASIGMATRNPAATIIMVLLAVGINAVTTLWYLSWDAIISLVIIGIALLWISRS